MGATYKLTVHAGQVGAIIYAVYDESQVLAVAKAIAGFALTPGI